MYTLRCGTWVRASLSSMVSHHQFLKVNGVAWSPDGERLVAVTGIATNRASSIVIVTNHNSQRRLDNINAAVRMVFADVFLLTPEPASPAPWMRVQSSWDPCRWRRRPSSDALGSIKQLCSHLRI